MLKMRKRKLTPIFLEGIFAHGRKKRFFENFYHDFYGESLDNFSRYSHFKFLIIFAGILICLRLFQLTVIEGAKYRELAENNRVRHQLVRAPRGRILDRYGQELANSATRFFLEKDNQLTEIDERQITDLEKQGLAGENFSGELGRVRQEVVRVYPNSLQFAHVLGYVSPVQGQDQQRDKNLSNLDNVGRLGIEAAYDEVLRGENGAVIVEVNANNQVISILGQKEAVSGQDIKLTIDAQLQRKLFGALSAQIIKVKSNAGAAIISDVASGEILAMVSYPSFDPVNVGQAVVSGQQPLFNRAIAGTYAPGSVFKPVSAVAGLVSGKINMDTEIEDVGEFSIGEFKFGNWYFLNYGGRDGFLKIDRAIARSNDIFFYRLAELVGQKVLRQTAIKFGFGQKTGVDLPGESPGLVPDEVWKESAYGQGWFLGDTMHMAIGQGFVTSTPMQVNNMTSAIANGGKLTRPHLVSKVAKNGSWEILVSASDAKTIADRGIISIVGEGMRMACEKGGTGWPFFDAPYKVGCKTGTAEKLQGNPHAWFTAFAPYDVPKIAITVIIENGGEGSSVAAPVAREVLDWWFEEK